MICTGCGQQNQDGERFCQKCGKKLQSSRRMAASDDNSSAPLPRFTHHGLPEDRWLTFRRLVEAWGYLGVLAVVAAVCFFQKTWWPLYPAVVVLGLLLWFRRI
ncbi:zinc-ribbon domain-containing protein [Pseudodesulfovibrio cashew]|uniref:Zinc-ribbon domain-containing protein n=1 Tax=Pseudodesulfovibrio cashew TaxID=2678688 RepID=A0A6I6JL67_9BACT|nr:zinc-ribbon domain-containing protein [Pseudodesulfovibrio cashew]